MFKHIAIITLFFLASSKTFAGFIYADDFAVGQDVSHLTDNATLSWLEGTGNSSSSSVFSPGAFYHQHFGGITSATTSDTFPGILNEALGSPNPQIYSALEIDFDSPIRSFGLKAENHTSSPFGLYLYDAVGDFIKVISVGVINTGVEYPGGDGNRIFDASYNWNFDFDVGMIKVGGASDAGYIYALDVTQVPEPSSFVLLLIGLLCVIKVRRSANTVLAN